MVQHFWETEKIAKKKKERKKWLHQSPVNFVTDCPGTISKYLIINASPEMINIDVSVKSKGSGVLTYFLCKNIREKLNWKGLSLSAPKQQRCVIWLFCHQMTDSYVQKGGECAYKSTEDQPLAATLVYQMNMMPLSLGCSHL